MCEVTSVFWFHERILAAGWNKHVIEFSDTAENELGDGKMWDKMHTEDILATAARSPQTLATSSYSGEVVLWTLETGQPYRRFEVENPTARIKVRHMLSGSNSTAIHFCVIYCRSRTIAKDAFRRRISTSSNGRKVAV